MLKFGKFGTNSSLQNQFVMLKFRLMVTPYLSGHNTIAEWP